MVLFGTAALVPGLRLWHRLGPRFGLPPGEGRVERRDALAVAALLVAVVGIELLLFD
jgi:hypothetical protein